MCLKIFLVWVYHSEYYYRTSIAINNWSSFCLKKQLASIAANQPGKKLGRNDGSQKARAIRLSIYFSFPKTSSRLISLISTIKTPTPSLFVGGKSTILPPSHFPSNFLSFEPFWAPKNPLVQVPIPFQVWPFQVKLSL